MILSFEDFLKSKNCVRVPLSLWTTKKPEKYKLSVPVSKDTAFIFFERSNITC